ncbi:hypothetical protein ACFRCG_12460 [Embleya sp. NPDC056575]|uniref:hypothetical protein n=1 Tax=unclassified Embleya TaxID=2699296 RepID=UPI0036AAD4BF
MIEAADVDPARAQRTALDRPAATAAPQRPDVAEMRNALITTTTAGPVATAVAERMAYRRLIRGNGPERDL